MSFVPHLKLADSNKIKYAILPGDPARIDHIAKYMTDVKELAYNREFRTVTGKYQGIEVLAVSTGIGGPSAAIVVEELHQIGVTHMIRIGSCGALQKGMRVGDMVLVSGAVRDDGTSKTYIEPSYPAVADYTVLSACIQSAQENQRPFHVGIARSHDSFYTDEKEEIYAYWKKKGIIASDMETAALYVVGGLRGIKCASILNVVVGSNDDLQNQINQYSTGENMAALGEEREILTALDAFVRIENM